MSLAPGRGKQLPDFQKGRGEWVIEGFLSFGLAIIPSPSCSTGAHSKMAPHCAHNSRVIWRDEAHGGCSSRGNFDAKRRPIRDALAAFAKRATEVLATFEIP